MTTFPSTYLVFFYSYWIPTFPTMTFSNLQRRKEKVLHRDRSWKKEDTTCPVVALHFGALGITLVEKNINDLCLFYNRFSLCDCWNGCCRKMYLLFGSNHWKGLLMKSELLLFFSFWISINYFIGRKMQMHQNSLCKINHTTILYHICVFLRGSICLKECVLQSLRHDMRDFHYWWPLFLLLCLSHDVPS